MQKEIPEIVMIKFLCFEISSKSTPYENHLTYIRYNHHSSIWRKAIICPFLKDHGIKTARAIQSINRLGKVARMTELCYSVTFQ